MPRSDNDFNYKSDGYDEFPPVKPAPQYLRAHAMKQAHRDIFGWDGLSTLIKKENGDVFAVEGRAEIIGIYDPSVSVQQLRDDRDAT